MRRLARHALSALLLAAALAALGCTGGSDDAATTATASPSATATATAVPTGTPTTTRTLTTSATGSGRVSPLPGTYSYLEGDSVTVTATPDEGWRLASWGGDCSTVGATSSTCTLTMDANKTVTVTFTALAADRCTESDDPDCIRAVYRGASTDYAQVADIPADKLLTADTGGHYYVERGEQYTVVTAARLPAGWTRFYLQRDPAPAFGVPSPVSVSQLIKPVGTTYTFTVSEDDEAPPRFTFELKSAKPHPLRPNLKPILGDTVVTTVFQAPKFTYNRFDTTGAATAAGSYAFLMPDADSETAGATTTVTTYEQLRTESTVLRVNVTNADGVSLGGFYDSVEVDEVVEWRKANDCFTRYAVTSTPEPTTGYREFGVESIAYAFTGCSGAITTNASVSANWGDLPNLGGTSLTAPIVQGPFQLVPAGWTGATKPVGPRFPGRPTIPSVWTTSLAEARTFPHWREPDLPEGWSFTDAVSGDEADVGYFEAFYNGLTLIVSASGITAKFGPEEASATYRNNGSQTSVRETLQIAGRPARVHRSVTARQFPTTLYVWDEATGVLYTLAWNGNAAELIALAESMFE